MRRRKSKIAIISIIFISLIFTMLPNNLNNDKVDFRNQSDKNHRDNFSNLQLSSPSNKRWWDSSYTYRMPINITNRYTGALPEGYSVNISVNTSDLVSSGKLRADGNDLRVVWYNSSTETWLELDRINETLFNTENTEIWFKTQASILPNSDNTNYYFYYGNAQADDPPANRINIYDFFDDFTQPDGSANGWTVTQGTGWSVINNEYRENQMTTDCRTILNSYTVENATIEVRIKHTGVGTMFGGGIMFRYSDGNNFYTSGSGFWGDEVGTGIWFGSTPGQLDGTGSELDLLKDNWYDFKIEMLGDQYDVYLDDTLKNSVTNNSHPNAGQIGFMTWTNELSVFFDDLKVRLLVSSEPSLSLNIEESYGSWFNNNWYYRKLITVTTDSAALPSGYTVSLTFDHTDLVSKAKSQADGDDIRVVFWNGTNWVELDRILDSESSWNSNSTKIWFKTQAAIATSSFDNNYYLYYGNSLASSPPNNSDNIFLFHDGFESGDLSGWDDNSTGSVGDSIIASTDQAYAGTYSAKCDMDDVHSPQAMVLENFSDEVNLFARVHIYLDPSFSVLDRMTVIQFVDTYYTWKNLISVTIDDDMTLYMWNANASEAYGWGEGNTISKGSWHTLDVQVHVSDTSGIARLWLDGNLEIDNTSISLGNQPTDIFATGIYWAGDNEYNTIYIDDIHLRIGIDPEPILTLSTEEKLRPSINDFNYYKEITIDHTKVSGLNNLINFPVLISILDSDLSDKVQSNGNDIAFYNGTHWLDHEIELFNQTYSSTQAQLITWVRIPSLSPTTSTTIYMYYGNSTMSPQENPEGVWDANYVGVWHLSEDPTGTLYDSTTKSNDGSSYGSMDSGDQILGKVDGSINFDGNDDNIATEENDLLAGCSSLTMSAWIKPLSTQSDFCGIIEYDNTTDGSSFDAGMELRSTRVPRVNIWTTSGFEYVDSSVVLPTTQFTYFVFVYDGDLNIYLDGSFDSSTPHSGNVRNNRRYINVGRNTHDGVSFNGIIDEIHISNINRSAEWITTEYNNQYDPSSFYSIGKEYSVSFNEDYFKYYKEITIDHSKVAGSSDLYNFPLLISIYDSDLHNHTQSDGDDIAFYDGTEWLNHEIELFNQNFNLTHAQLIAWVRVPVLSTSTDTKIYLYYGNTTISSLENPKGVWDDNYLGIWHLSEDPTGSIYDSTSKDNDGTTYGSMNSADQVSGKIDGSIEFDGDNDYIDCGNDTSLDITGDITIEFWVNGESFSNDLDPDILTKGSYTQAYSTWINDDGAIYFQLNGDSLYSTYKLSLRNWYRVVCTRNSNNRTIYINGAKDISDTFSSTIETITDSLTICRSPDNLNGTLDEIRLSNVARSSDWIATEYNNQYNPNNFYTIGIEIQINDTNPPDIIINLPKPNELFGLSAPNYDLTVIDPKLDSIWYSLDGGANSTPISASGTLDQTMWDGRPNGTVTIRFYANDTVGNLNYEEVIIRKDIVDPSVDSIDSPSSGAWFGSTPPSYSISITEENLDEISYSLDGGLNNYTGATSGTIDATAWSNTGQGNVTIMFYVNDSAGNWDSASVIINRDTIDPNLVIIEPNNYDIFGTSPPSITINISDSNLNESWYHLDNGTVITANYTWTGFIAQSVWDQVGNGTVTIRFYANDTAGNLGTAEVLVYKDIFFPIITINTPNSDDVFGSSAPNFVVGISGSNLNTSWYTLDSGIVNYTFTGLTGTINQSAWDDLGDGTVTLKFYINNTLGIIGYDEITVIKDTYAPQITINLPLNNTYCGFAPIINVLVIDGNLDAIWYEVNTNKVLLTNNVDQQLEASIWSSLLEGEFFLYIYANDSGSNLSDPVILRLYKDTFAPSAPSLTSYPQGEVSGNLLFEWLEGSDPSGILKYRLIIDNEEDPFATPGFLFDINVTENSYEFTGTLQPGTYHFFLYQIDAAGNQGPAFTRSFTISSTGSPSQPSGFPIWIIFIIIGLALGGVVGFVVLKKSKSKKDITPQIPDKKPISKPIEEISKELTLLDYEMLKVKNLDELNERKEKVLVYIKKLKENKEYIKTAEFIGELILIEEILENFEEAKLYRQKQIDIAIKGLEYLKDQYEVESKNAAISGDYSKAIELYKESKLISDNLKVYIENQESSDTKQGESFEIKEPESLMKEIEIVYSCINDLLTKYFDEIGIKFYSNPLIYEDGQNQIHGLILTDNKLLIEDVDPKIRDKIKSIQIRYTVDISNENILKLCKEFQSPYALLIIVGIISPNYIEARTIDITLNKDIKYQENIRINQYEEFIKSIGFKDVYEKAFNEIINLYKESKYDILRETHESSEVIIHSTGELIYDLKEKGLIKHNLKEYFQA